MVEKKLADDAEPVSKLKRSKHHHHSKRRSSHHKRRRSKQDNSEQQGDKSALLFEVIPYYGKGDASTDASVREMLNSAGKLQEAQC